MQSKRSPGNFWYKTLLILGLNVFTTNASWAMSCEENLGRLPEVRKAIHRLETLQQLVEAGLGSAEIKPIKEELLGYEDLLQIDEPLNVNDLRHLDFALQTADNLRLTVDTNTRIPAGGPGDIYDSRFGKRP